LILPVVDAGPDIYMQQGAVVTIAAIASNTTSGTTYTWFPVDELDNPGILNPATHATQNRTYMIVVSNGPGCEGTDSVHVYMSAGELTVPAAFSPDHDGVNDLFRLLNKNYHGKYHMEIYDRWGEKVFETEDPQAGWDGTFKGEALPIDAYTYLIRYESFPGPKTEYKQGSVSLIRGH